MKLLVHACCAHCAIGVLRRLAEQGCDVTAYFDNPNIHPLLEFRRRLKAMKVLRGRLGAKEPAFAQAVYVQDYGLEPFLSEAYAGGAPGRCERCYRMRLAAAARRAAEHGFDGFTTTLLISPRQDHERLRALGQAAAERHGVAFHYEDFRPLFEQSRQAAKELMLYSQSYCGCVFSEHERYRDTAKHLYRGRAPEEGA